VKASKTYEGSTRPEHGVTIGMKLAGYSNLETPAISAALLLHHLQRKAMIFGFGFNIFDIFIHDSLVSDFSATWIILTICSLV